MQAKHLRSLTEDETLPNSLDAISEKQTKTDQKSLAIELFFLFAQIRKRDRQSVLTFSTNTNTRRLKWARKSMERLMLPFIDQCSHCFSIGGVELHRIESHSHGLSHLNEGLP